MHDVPYMLAAIAVLTIITVLTRSSFFMLPARIELPARVERSLRYAPACALTAIIAQGVLAPGGDRFVSVENNQMWALLAASAVYAKTRSMLATMAVGMTLFTVLRVWL